jgi:hypothetical protein
VETKNPELISIPIPSLSLGEFGNTTLDLQFRPDIGLLRLRIHDAIFSLCLMGEHFSGTLPPHTSILPEFFGKFQDILRKNTGLILPGFKD